MKITIERSSAQQIQHPGATLTPPPPSDLSLKPKFPRKPPRRKIKTSAAGVRVKGESSERGTHPETPLLRWKFDGRSNSVEEEEKSPGEVGRKSERRVRPVVSSRKLGAGLWRLHSPEFQANSGSRLGLQSGGGHRVDRIHSSRGNNLVHSSHYVSVPKNGLQHKLFEPSFQFSNAKEGETKWDPTGGRTSDEFKQIFGKRVLLNQRENDAPIISNLESQLEQARSRINELETEQRSSKKKLDQFLQKLSDEKAAWRSREHEKIRTIMDDIKAELTQEKKHRQKLEAVNSKLVNELTEAKKSVKCYMHEYEKERKARGLIEQVCDELATEIGEDKAEVEKLKRESRKLWEEVEEERKMLQMAEVWREERVQMKLVDAKVMLEEKYSQMSTIISHLDEMKRAEFLEGAAAPGNIQDIEEMTYLPLNDSRIHTPTDKSGEIDEDASDWETVSHLEEDRGSIYSPNGSEVGISNLWRSNPSNGDDCKIVSADGVNRRVENGRLLSSVDIVSPDRGSGKDGQWGPLDSGKSRVKHGVQKGSLKARLLEARIESRKIQLHQGSKQKI